MPFRGEADHPRSGSDATFGSRVWYGATVVNGGLFIYEAEPSLLIVSRGLEAVTQGASRCWNARRGQERWHE